MSTKPQNPIAIKNQEKYGKPPKWEVIEAFIKKTGIKMYAFERFYGMPQGSLAKIKNCYKYPGHNRNRDLSSNYWHIIYEQIIPQYGVKYVLVKKSDLPKVVKVKPERVYKKREAKVIELENDTHGRVNKIK